MESIVREFHRADGELKVLVYHREDGFYTLGEETRHWEEAHLAIGEGFYYWVPTERGTSLFETLDMALTEVAARYEWVRSKLNQTSS
jgi:hypothetical protein